MKEGTRLKAGYAFEFEMLATERNGFLQSRGALELYGLDAVEPHLEALWKFQADLVGGWQTLVVCMNQEAPANEYIERTFGEASKRRLTEIRTALRDALRPYARHEV